MALVSCQECGKQISDKAVACPGCGCPTEAGLTKKQEQDYSGYTKDALWQKAYNIQYKGKKSELPIAIQIYEYIICNYENSNESKYAKDQLNILQSRADEESKLNQVVPKWQFTATQLNKYELMSASKIFIEANSYQESNNKDDNNKAIQLYELIISKYPQSDEAILSQQRVSLINANDVVDVKSINNTLSIDTKCNTASDSDYSTTDVNGVSNNVTHKGMFLSPTSVGIAIVFAIALVLLIVMSKHNNASRILKKELNVTNIDVTSVPNIESCYWFDEIDKSKIFNNRKRGFAKIENGKITNINYYSTNLEIGAIETCKGLEYVTPTMQIFNGRANSDILSDNNGTNTDKSRSNEDINKSIPYDNNYIYLEPSHYGKFVIDEDCVATFVRNNGERIFINDKDMMTFCSRNEPNPSGFLAITRIADTSFPLNTRNGDEFHIFHDSSQSGSHIWCDGYFIIVINKQRLWVKKISLDGDWGEVKYKDIKYSAKVNIDDNSNTVIFMLKNKFNNPVAKYKLSMGELAEI